MSVLSVYFAGNISKDANPAESERAQQTALLNSFVLNQEKNPELLRLIRSEKPWTLMT